jgi:uncharacterized membrane protein
MSLTFCNRTTSLVSVAIMRFDPQSCPRGDRFSVQGWWNINPGGCAIVYGGAVNYNRFWYFHAEAASGLVWSGSVRAWVSNQAFKLCHSDSCTPCRIAGFQLIDVNNCTNCTVTLTP